MSNGKKIVVVFGATGTQGGSVIKSLLADPATQKEYHIRAITRDPSTAKAQALTKQGVECVTGDLGSKESLRKALEHAYAVYAVTSYWEKEDPELEKQQGRNVADAAKECGVQHFIWSSLLDVNKLSHGQYAHVDHFDSKAAVEEYIRTLAIPATFFLPGLYMTNFSDGMLRPDAAHPGSMRLALPVPATTPFPLFDAGRDTGTFVKAILRHRAACLGQRVYGATDYYSAQQIVDQFGHVKAREAAFVQIPADDFTAALTGSGMSARGALEMTQNLLFMPEFGYYGKADLGPSLALLDNEKPTTWSEFVAQAPEWKDL
ncbi:MAG: hypothetical protein M1826_006892 [Phylliscum demangeonii]|nr:MAG: hypothetical protein M1826_006892 [Phylliscum demangeonii]